MNYAVTAVVVRPASLANVQKHFSWLATLLSTHGESDHRSGMGKPMLAGHDERETRRDTTRRIDASSNTSGIRVGLVT